MPPRSLTPRNISPVLGRAAIAAAFLSAATGVAPVSANDRHFTYTYESSVLPQGGREIEVWTTGRFGRENFYRRFDQRLEFEWGLTDRLQTAVYLNFTGLTADAGVGAARTRESSFEYAGISSEWKYKVFDPVADAIGFALYGEVTLAPVETEFEAKLIFDKKLGNLLLATNLVGELELENELEPTGETKLEKKYLGELDLAAGYFLLPNLSVGLEMRNRNVVKDGKLEASALFLGPVVAYAAKAWWVALTVMPQVTALKKNDAYTGADGRDLVGHEKLNARLLFSFHL